MFDAKEVQNEVNETERELMDYAYIDPEDYAHSVARLRRWVMCQAVVTEAMRGNAKKYFDSFKSGASVNQLMRIASRPEIYEYLAVWADCEIIARALEI